MENNGKEMDSVSSEREFEKIRRSEKCVRKA
jgi:hypothetical protein